LFNQLDIVYLDPADLPTRAIELAELFHRPNTYDSFYLALAERLDCPFWTADERLFNAVSPGFKLIHWLGQPGKTSPP
jgi:predicted nucleic acid-binding protein